MPNWTAPFHTPNLRGDAFKQKKAETAAKEGYQINIPSLEDIFHIKTVEPMTAGEKVAWKQKDWRAFSDRRYEELVRDKQKKKDRYQAALHSPTPDIYNSAAAILTSLDDVQDVASTLSTVGRLAIRLAPRMLAKGMLGPVGWIMTAADIINAVMILGRIMTLPMTAKRHMNLATAMNPFCKEAKLARATKISKPWPTVGNTLEALQVTDQVFGYGISLGAIAGCVSDLMFGGIRMALGQPVTIQSSPEYTVGKLSNFMAETTTPPPWDGRALATPGSKAFTDPYYNSPWATYDTTPPIYAASKVPKAAMLIMACGYTPSDEDIRLLTATNYLAEQELASNLGGFNGVEQVKDVEKAEMRVPTPSNILSMEIMDEEHVDAAERLKWPHNNKLWAKIDDLVREYPSPCKKFLQNTISRQEHTWDGWFNAAMMTESHSYSMANAEHENEVRYDYTEQARFSTLMLENGFYPDPNQPQEKLDKLAKILDDNQKFYKGASFKQYQAQMNRYGIKFLRV